MMVAAGVTVADLVATGRSLNSDSARLDVELLLGCVLGKDRAFLRAWPEHEVTTGQSDAFGTLLARRRAGEPMAYILGYREFWSLCLEVSPHTLIPRPATETLVSVTLQLADAHWPASSSLRVLDLGTGSGAVALALASERPLWQIDAVDVDHESVRLTERNASAHALGNVSCWYSDWFLSVERGYDLVVANPPYIDGADRHLQQGDVRFEPRRALVAAEGGLGDLRHIIHQARDRLQQPGLLVVEHGYDQADRCRQLFDHCGYRDTHTVVDSDGQPRVTHGCWLGGDQC